MPEDVVLFTGISGISHEECLHKLKCPEGQAWRVRSLDALIGRKLKARGKTFTQFLMSPPDRQVEEWRLALKAIGGERRGESPLLLTFHAVYYHPSYRDFISPVHWESLQAIGRRTSMLVVLLDDIYDIYLQLMREGRMYSHILKRDTYRDRRTGRYQTYRAIYESIVNLISILQWRQQEITVSRLIARRLGKRIFVVAAKHPVKTVERLVRLGPERATLAYLSHPVSSVREAARAELPSFPHKVNDLVSRLMSRLPNLVMFQPGTVDELRIRRQDSGAGAYVPDLDARWPLLEPHLALDLPPDVAHVNPLNPLDYRFRRRSQMRASVSYLLELLARCITQQVTSRDLTLVEQSTRGVVAVRPHLPGHLARGVRRELQHNLDVSTTEEPGHREALVLTTATEAGRSQLDELWRRVLDSLDAESMSYEEGEALRTRLEEWHAGASDELALAAPGMPGMDPARLRDELEAVLPPTWRFRELDNGGPLRAEYPARQEELRQARSTEIINVTAVEPARSLALGPDNYKVLAGDSYWEEAAVAAEEFLSRWARG